MSFTKGSKPSKNRCKSSEKWRTEVLLFPDSGAGQARCACLAPTAPALSLVPARLGSTLQDRPPPGHRRSRLCAVGPWARSALGPSTAPRLSQRTGRNGSECRARPPLQTCVTLSAPAADPRESQGNPGSSARWRQAELGNLGLRCWPLYRRKDGKLSLAGRGHPTPPFKNSRRSL